MKTIAAVAIAAIDEKAKTLYTDGWGKDYYDLYHAWLEMRRANGGEKWSMCQWRDTIKSLMDDLKRSYTKVKRKDRYMSWETANICVSVHVMCGFKECPQWETAVSVAIVDHNHT